MQPEGQKGIVAARGACKAKQVCFAKAGRKVLLAKAENKVIFPPADVSLGFCQSSVLQNQKLNK